MKRVFEVYPLECPKCGSKMKVIAFIERCQRDVVEKILRHCGLCEGPLRTSAQAYRNLSTTLTRISQMTPFALACNLRHTLENKEFDAFHVKVTGEPSG